MPPVEESAGAVSLLGHLAQPLVDGTLGGSPVLVVRYSGLHLVFPKRIAAKTADDGADRQLQRRADIALPETPVGKLVTNERSKSWARRRSLNLLNLLDERADRISPMAKFCTTFN